MMDSAQSLAPVGIFCYRRPTHLTQVLDALEACPEYAQTPIYVFCDGAKGDADAEDVAAVRRLLKQRLPAHAHIVEREANVGLAGNIVDGVTAMCGRHGCAIVLEDDLVVSPAFLRYMNAALDRYRDDERVMQIAGCSYDLDESRPAPYFLPIAASWGWATWQRAWSQFDAEAPGWTELLEDRSLRRRFDIDGTFGFTLMMFGYKLGKNNSWLVRWNWAIFRRRGSVLFPGVSLVSNIGQDGGGTHGRGALRNFAIQASAAPPVDEMCRAMPRTSQVEASSQERLRALMRARNGGWAIRSFDRLRTVLRARKLRRTQSGSLAARV